MAKIGTYKICKAFNNDYTKCGKNFPVTHVKQKFCSDKCRKRNNRKIKEREIKRTERANAKMKKKNHFINSKQGRATKIHNDLLELSLSMDFYKNPISIPEEKSISDFSDIDSFYTYTNNRTSLERQEKNRKTLKKSKLKELENIAESKIIELLKINDFMLESENKDKKKVQKLIENLKKLKSRIGEITRSKVIGNYFSKLPI